MVNYRYVGRFGSGTLIRSTVPPPGPVSPPTPVTPANGYVLEDGVTFYVAEDGVTFYVQES